MTTEIRKEIREYIIEDVNITLSRLGISEALANEEIITNNRTDEVVRYEYTTKNIKQYPVMFKALNVTAFVQVAKLRENDPFYDESKQAVCVDLHYFYKHFDGGQNGCTIGSVWYLVDDDLPKKFDIDDFEDSRRYYVRKIKSLAI